MSFKMIIYLGRLLPAASSNLPETKRAASLSLLGLASDGVYTATPVTRCAVVSYTRRFTLTMHAWRYTFCCTFLRVTSTGRYPASCPMKPGLSSPATQQRSSSPPISIFIFLSSFLTIPSNPLTTHRILLMPYMDLP